MGRLAIAGGTPVRNKPWPAWPQFDERERARVLEVLESGNWGGFPFPNKLACEFAERFAAFQSARYGLCVANGTVAIEVGLRAIGFKAGDEAIIPAYTFEATAAPVLRLGGVPVFVDVLPDTYCIDPAVVEAAITPRTRVIVPVHLAMSMADMDAIGLIAARHGLKVLEDCAHAHGARWRGQGAGSIGDAGAFSMQTSKLMTCGEGGAVLINDQETFELCQSYVNCGRASLTDRFGHRIIGFNYRIAEFQAALLLAQLERLPEQTSHRQTMAERLGQGLASISGVGLLSRDERQTTRAIYQYVFKYDADGFAGASRDRFVAALEAEGIPCDGLFYEPVYRSAMFVVEPGEFIALVGQLPWQNTRCPVAEKAAYEEAVWLPHHLLLGDGDDVDQVVEAVTKIAANVDELRRAEHPLIGIKSMNRAERRD
jgi:dTDP-4-amino-4,6-dideoxygalactose transaminase